MRKIVALIIPMLISLSAAAQNSVSAGPGEVAIRLGMEGDGFSRAVNVFLLITILSLVPAIFMMMTSFVRIVIVLGFLGRALGTQGSPSPKILSALALFLTLFIMEPVWTEVYSNSIKPYSDGEITQTEAVDRGLRPLKGFMKSQTRESSMFLFMDMANLENIKTEEEIPLRVLLPAFMVSELQTAFQMGFLIFLPFLLIDAVVATLLMSMGMMMLPPMMISLPMKLLLFILCDGWNMIVQAVVSSFG